MEPARALEVVERLPSDATDAQCAAAVDLVLSDDATPGIRRVRRGTGFSYHGPDGTLLEGPDRERCVQLAVPPAWTDVWICPETDGHLQATGRDDAGRKQYLYHGAWRALREATKFAALAGFGTQLPTIRTRVDRDLRRRNLDRERVLAMVIALLDETLVRVGNEEHADEDGGHGLTTLTREHLELRSTVASFAFLGKSGVAQEHVLRNRRLVRQLQRMVGAGQPQLFAWANGDGGWHDVRGADVNQHLRELTGHELSAKDFRTWGGTVRALAVLDGMPPADDERELEAQRRAAVDAAAEALGNTRAVARASYVHPMVLDAHGTDAIAEVYDDDDAVVEQLGPHERALLRLLGAGGVTSPTAG